MAYEYKMIVTARPTMDVADLNYLGEDRWRLVAVYEHTDQWIYVFTRQVDEDDEQ